MAWIETAMNIALIGMGSLIAIMIVAVGGMMYIKKKKFGQFRCIVFEKDGFGQIKETYDNAGIFVDKKTGNKRFFMRKFNVGLEPDNIPYIEVGKVKKVYLYRNGLKNFRFLRIKVDPLDQMKFKVGEEDVNWALNQITRNQNILKNNTWKEYLPFIGVMFATLVVLIIVIYLLRNMSQLTEMAKYLKEAATALANANTGTTVISGS